MHKYLSNLHAPLSILPLLLLGLLTSCASIDEDMVEGNSPETAQMEPGSTETTTAAAESGQPIPAPEEDIKYGNFSEDILTRVIIAEMAGQRGLNQKALNDYTDLARETNDLNIIKRASRIASFLRNVSVAVEMGNMWLAKDPESQEALRTLSFQMVSMGRYREAVDHLTKLLELGAVIDFRLISNQTASDTNASLVIDALIADFEDLRTLYPENQSLRLGLAHLYQQNEQVEDAYELVRNLAKEMDDNPEVVILEVDLLEQMGEAALAKRRLEQSLRNNKNHKELRFQYARKLVDEQRYREAHDQFEIIVEQFPDDYDMLYSLALISMEINMLNEAKLYFSRLVENAHRLDDSHYYLGFINAQENNTDTAIEHFFNVNGGGNFLPAQRSLAELMIRAGRYKEVKARLQNIRFRNSDYNIPLLTMEANVLMDEGFLDEAGTVLNNAVGAFPNNIQLLFLRSVYSQEINDLTTMEVDLRKIIQLNPNSPVAYNSLGYYLADRSDRIEEAYELIQRAVELAPNDPAIIDSLGWVQYRLGLYDEARQNLDKAYELYPDHEVAAHLGEVLWVMGEKSAARAVWRKALESQPDSEYIRSAMERLTSDSSI
ncbi:MAG: tetratricopeptide repeat protein [Gammaproteobacteria bacterium]|nr:tetratricopeptide repeat protein [Gammaproteobacteria bacterium]MBT6042959.1 tetratricopeptide repeat protein [Gammaproteobacteria bacterium]